MVGGGMSLRKVPWHLRYRTGARLASEVRKAAVRATHLHCTVEFQGPAWIGPGFALEIPDHGSLIVGSGVVFRRGFACEISGGGRVTIGDGTMFTSHAMIGCSTTIDIGRRCVIGQSVLVMDGFHRFRDPDKHILDQGYDFRPIKIGDGAIINAKASITNSVGAGSLVGAGAVVTRPIPDRCFAVGAPARVIEYFGRPEDRPAELAGRDN